MELKSFSDYELADITTKDLTDISKLEKAINIESNTNIVLIAYQPKAKD